jgi:hypothetical protein
MIQIFNLIVITPQPSLQLSTIYLVDVANPISMLIGGVARQFSPNAFQLSAFESKKDSVGNAEATAPFAYNFTTNLNYLMSGSRIEIYQSEVSGLELGANGCPKVFDGYIGSIKQANETTYEIVNNLFLLKRYTGKRISKYCYKELGDSECGVAIAAHRFNTKITTGYDRGLNGLLLSNCPDLITGAFTDGFLVILQNASYPDQKSLIAGKYHIFTDARVSATTRRIWLSQVGYAAKIEPQNCRLIRGCDHTSTACNDIYDNISNFGGFEFLPGNDRLFASN